MTADRASGGEALGGKGWGGGVDPSQEGPGM